MIRVFKGEESDSRSRLRLRLKYPLKGKYPSLIKGSDDGRDPTP